MKVIADRNDGLFVDELNDYRLKVTGLKAGKYEVRVGGKEIAELTADQPAAGANLASGALADGPIAEQAKAVRAAVENKNRFHPLPPGHNLPRHRVVQCPRLGL